MSERELDQLVESLDESRRRFLGKLLAGGAALALPATASVALGDDDRGATKKKATKKKAGKKKGAGKKKTAKKKKAAKKKVAKK